MFSMLENAISFLRFFWGSMENAAIAIVRIPKTMEQRRDRNDGRCLVDERIDADDPIDTHVQEHTGEQCADRRRCFCMGLGKPGMEREDTGFCSKPDKDEGESGDHHARRKCHCMLHEDRPVQGPGTECLREISKRKMSPTNEKSIAADAIKMYLIAASIFSFAERMAMSIAEMIVVISAKIQKRARLSEQNARTMTRRRNAPGGIEEPEASFFEFSAFDAGSSTYPRA